MKMEEILEAFDISTLTEIYQEKVREYCPGLLKFRECKVTGIRKPDEFTVDSREFWMISEFLDDKTRERRLGKLVDWERERIKNQIKLLSQDLKSL